MPRKRMKNPLKVIGVGITPKIHRELSELCWALERPISDIAREMIENDIARFKDRHRQAIREGKQSEDKPVSTNS